MRPLLLAALLTGVAFAQGPSQPFPNHEQPPEGWFCVPARDAKALETEAHACACRGMMMDHNPEEHCKKVPVLDEEGNPTGQEELTESAKCKVYCHKDHCHCRAQCETT